jgi:hypothetical protein
LNALNTETVAEPTEEIKQSAENSFAKESDESDIYKAIALASGAGIVLLSIALVVVFKQSGKTQQSDRA